MKLSRKDKKEALTAPSVPWLQAIRNNRLLLAVVVVLSIVILAQAGAMVMLFPLKERVPVIVEFQTGGNNFVRITKAGKDITANEALLSASLRYYVASREQVDHITEVEIRYPRVIAMSNPDVINTFRQLYGDKNRSLYYNESVTRDIIILRDSSLSRGIHQVEFSTIDKIKGREDMTRSNWIATIHYTFSPQEVSFDNRILNPTGLIVTNYHLAKRQGA